jgi:hypothetical protein
LACRCSAAQTRGAAAPGGNAAQSPPSVITAPLPWDAALCAHFLETYWQRRPLLVRQAVPNFKSPLDPDELAGLAGEAPSRIVLEQGGATPWELVRTRLLM